MPFVAVATQDRHGVHLKLEDLHTSWTFIEIDGVPGDELQRIPQTKEAKLSESCLLHQGRHVVRDDVHLCHIELVVNNADGVSEIQN